ncbi:MAG: TlpA disulfide reductase family protein [Caulobacteraceae bacterium]
MKKSIIIWVTALVLVVVAVYTANRYNANSNVARNNAQQAQETSQTAPSPTFSPTPANSSATGTQNEEPKLNLLEEYDFTLEDLDGNKVTLSSYKGKKLYINFWATWCPPCKAEMPDIEKLYQETKDSDLVILAVNIGEDKKTVQDFIKKNNYHFKVLLDTDSKVAQLYQASSIPTSYFVDSEGYLDDGMVGAMPLESMRKYVEKLK